MNARDSLARLLWWTGLAAAARRVLARKGGFVLMFHGVAARRYDELPPAVQPSFDATELRAALTWIAKRFRFLTPEELLGGRTPGVLLTFDDGYANNRAQALPVLEDFAAPAVFFVTTRHVRDPRDWLPATREKVARHWRRARDVPEPLARDLYDGLSRADLRACSDHPAIVIGSHTLHHPRLTSCDDAALAHELGESKRLLESWCGREVDLFAYPKGDYDRRVALAVRDAGYRAAFAEDPAGAGLPAYEIPRIGLYGSGAAYLGAKLSGLHRPPWPGVPGAASP